MVTLRHLKPS